MENIQINGQRIWGPPSDWMGPPPPYGTEVFIKNVPEDITETDLYQIFASVGRVYEVRLPIHWNGLNRGYAFVRYTKTESANAAIKELNKLNIRCGWYISVERSIDNNRLFLSAVPNEKTGEEILKDLTPYVENVKKVYVYPCLENPDLNRGYAFVEFACHRDAAIAKRILTPDVCFNIFDRKCIAAWANPLPYLQDNVVEKINTLFIRNIPKDMKHTAMKNRFEEFLGQETILRVKKLNGIAFLTFKNHFIAKSALEIVKDNPTILGRNEVEIEWAVPRHMAHTKCSVQKPLADLKCPSSLDKDTLDRISDRVEKTWTDQLMSKQCLRKMLRYDSNLTDCQKNMQLFIRHRVEPTKDTEEAIKELITGMRKKNVNPDDFINRHLIGFGGQSVSGSFTNLVGSTDSGAECNTSEDSQLFQTEYRFDKFVDDGSQSLPNSYPPSPTPTFYFKNDDDFKPRHKNYSYSRCHR